MFLVRRTTTLKPLLRRSTCKLSLNRNLSVVSRVHTIKPSPRCSNFHLFSTRLGSNLKIMKLDTPEFKSLFTSELEVLIKLFSKHGYELRIAGGAVRDLLMSKVPHDLDFATTATPDQMKTMFEEEGIRMINTRGEKHGTITCRINNKENFEVTTLRIDVTTDGRHAEVQFTQDWELDALRRDLTINSLFLGFDGTIHDYFAGIQDLEERRVRFVGEAEKRIQEDYLRILRYFRFYGRIAEHADQHDADTLRVIKNNMSGLAAISGERIWVELKQILVGNHADSLVRVMMDVGLAPYIGLPPTPDVAEFTAIWARCHDLQPAPLTVLAALMTTEDMVYTMNKRLKLSREELKLGTFLIQFRHSDFGPDPLKFCQDLLCDVTGKEPRSKFRISELLKYCGKRDVMEQFEAWQQPRFPVNGFSLLERGLVKGPQMAKTLHELRQIWKKSNYTLSQEELLEYIDKIKPGK